MSDENDELIILVRKRNSIQTRRSPESSASFNPLATLQESTTSPLPVANSVQRTSVFASGGGYTSPDFQKPPTPYEDKVIPTLRNRNRTDGTYVQNSVAINNDAGATSTEETESIYGGGTVTSNDDGIAELNQAEMIEANQIMVVFDKQLVSR